MCENNFRNTIPKSIHVHASWWSKGDKKIRIMWAHKERCMNQSNTHVIQNQSGGALKLKILRQLNNIYYVTLTTIILL